MKRVRRGPLPDDIFDRVNTESAIVFLPRGQTLIVWRDPRTWAIGGIGPVHLVSKRGMCGLDNEFAPRGQGWIRARWLADPRRRELRLTELPSFRRGRRKFFYLTDAQWVTPR